MNRDKPEWCPRKWSPPAAVLKQSICSAAVLVGEVQDLLRCRRFPWVEALPLDRHCAQLAVTHQDFANVRNGWKAGISGMRTVRLLLFEITNLIDRQFAQPQIACSIEERRVMHSVIRYSLAATIAFLAASAAQAECKVSSDPGFAIRTLNATSQADANIVASMAVLPRAMRIDYKSATKKSGCSLGLLADTGPTYELWGSDKDGRQRKAIPLSKGAPAALIIPIVDLLKQLSAKDPSRSGAIDGFLLATISNDTLTGWRYFTGMPDTPTLKREMSEALAGRGRPIFRSAANGTMNITLPAR